ncbi:MAG: hypothetical protein COV47_00895 [Candidatus Diapherotrites archaeon CG11_big_fil_rev_8_21_14_0_20_37_9]|nr:MAG: hypothetical protein COV47_00895 [Candidatus Diapherotrites archaeon CG11_big_fil_rev_8_21_14_0_20_37_9]
MTYLFEGAFKKWKQNLIFITISIIFWLIEFSYQQSFLGNNDLGISVLRASAFTGITFISFALLSSIIFKFRPALAKHWDIRRNFGVIGFIFIAIHVLTATNILFMGNIANALFILDPFQNPVIFGLIAYPLLFIIAITSTDWAVKKLGGKWKRVQQLVYFVYFLSVFHFLLVNPPAIMNLAGYLVMLLIVLVLIGELYFFYLVSKQRQFKNKSLYVGILIIALYIIIAYFAYFS